MVYGGEVTLVVALDVAVGGLKVAVAVSVLVSLVCVAVAVSVDEHRVDLAVASGVLCNGVGDTVCVEVCGLSVVEVGLVAHGSDPSCGWLFPCRSDIGCG